MLAIPCAVKKATGNHAQMTIRKAAAENGVGKSVRAKGIQATAGMTPVIFRTGNTQ